MTYILTDSELQTLIAKSEEKENGLSPISVTVDIKKKILGNNLEYKAQGLSKTRLLEVGPDANYRISKEGSVLVKALVCPDTVAAIGRKNSTDGIFYCLKTKGIWFIYTSIPDQKLNIIISYFSSKTLGDWINEQFVSTAPIDIKTDTAIDIDLTYDEWYLWIMSQFVFMRRDVSGKKIDASFEISNLDNSASILYIADSLRAIGKADKADDFIQMFSHMSDKRISFALKGLVKKGLIDVKMNEKQHLIATYTDTAIKWLDNDILTDTLYFSLFHNQKHNTLLFQLRRTGICAVYDTGSTIKFMTIHSIPWSVYMDA